VYLSQFDARRLHIVNEGVNRTGPIVYWMYRDQRADDNWALIYAQQLALESQQPLIVWVGLSPEQGNPRQLLFKLEGLQETHEQLSELNIPLIVEAIRPAEGLARLAEQLTISTIVTDFSPVRFFRQQLVELVSDSDIPLHQVDAHNIVPCRIASDKREYAAYTFRPKLDDLVSSFLVEFPESERHPFAPAESIEPPDWSRLRAELGVESTTIPGWITPGRSAGFDRLQSFLESELHGYIREEKHPDGPTCSGLPPWINSGQISAQRIALDALRYDQNFAAQEAFIEQLIVRRELSDNFVYYSENYDQFETFPQWARETLDLHRHDLRPCVHSLDQFERAITHDPLWNAAMTELRELGRMHNYLRMYWAKQILHWSHSPEDALEITLLLNDKYFLDGHDPNGYTGVAWAIGGVHDRAWLEREVFGKVRMMNATGVRKRFDIKRYIASVERDTGAKLT